MYTAPTSGGKTLIADLAILEQLFCNGSGGVNGGGGRNCIVMVPYVAVVGERVEELGRLAAVLPFRVLK